MKITEEKIEELEKQLQELKAEIKPKFKKGDFITNVRGFSKGYIAIFRHIDERGCLYYFCYAHKIEDWSKCSIDYGIGSIDDFELATESEKQLLLDKLHENGKDWDAEKCEIVDYKWRANNGEKYFLLTSDNLTVIESEEISHKYDTERYESGNYFKTRELAEAAAKKVKELLLTLKHS